VKQERRKQTGNLGEMGIQEPEIERVSCERARWQEKPRSKGKGSPTDEEGGEERDLISSPKVPVG
jgi:hypothetical protein